MTSSTAGVATLETAWQGEVFSDLHGIAPGHREQSGLWPTAVKVDWRQYQFARWWPLWVVLGVRVSHEARSRDRRRRSKNRILPAV